MGIDKKMLQPVLDSRHIKVLAAKKEQLKDAIVFICLDEEQYGSYDLAQLKKLAESIDKIESSAYYFIYFKNLLINIFDRSEIKGHDIIITVGHPKDISDQEVESKFAVAFSEARSVKFVHEYATVVSG